MHEKLTSETAGNWRPPVKIAVVIVRLVLTIAGVLAIGVFAGACYLVYLALSKKSGMGVEYIFAMVVGLIGVSAFGIALSCFFYAKAFAEEQLNQIYRNFFGTRNP